MIFKAHNIRESGSLLIEVLLAVALFGLITLTSMNAIFYGRESTSVAGDRSRAAQIANESVDAVQNIAHNSYANLSAYANGSDYYLDASGTNWTLVSTPTTINSFYTPKIVFADGPGGGRKATITITWQLNSQRIGTITAVTYLTDWQAVTLLLPQNIYLLTLEQRLV